MRACLAVAQPRGLAPAWLTNINTDARARPTFPRPRLASPRLASLNKGQALTSILCVRGCVAGTVVSVLISNSGGQYSLGGDDMPFSAIPAMLEYFVDHPYGQRKCGLPRLPRPLQRHGAQHAT